MNSPRHSLLTLLMVLLIAAAPMQGVFAAIAAANASDSSQQAATEMQHAHHQQGMIGSAAVAVASNDDSGMASVCDCCPDGVPGGCGNCAFNHCASHHCSSAAMLPLAGNAVFANDDAAWVLPQSAQLPRSTLDSPFRPPRA